MPPPPSLTLSGSGGADCHPCVQAGCDRYRSRLPAYTARLEADRTKRIGKAASWSWFATDVCSLKVTQFTPEPSSAKPSDSITVNLLWGPAIDAWAPTPDTGSHDAWFSTHATGLVRRLFDAAC